MRQEQMMTMNQLLQVFEGLHNTVSQNGLIIKATYFGLVVLVLLLAIGNHAVVESSTTPASLTWGVVSTAIIGLHFLAVAAFLVKRLKSEIKDANVRLKEVLGMAIEYRKTLAGLDPAFLKAVDLRLQRL